MTAQQQQKSTNLLRLYWGEGRKSVLSLCDVVSGSERSVHVWDSSWVTFVAIWDTGASISAVSEKIISCCGLTPTGRTTKIRFGDGKVCDRDTYLVNLRFPNGIEFKNMEVGSRPGDETHVLIGMDVIARGDFLVLGDGGEALFRYPSVNDGGAGMMVVTA